MSGSDKTIHIIYTYT